MAFMAMRDSGRGGAGADVKEPKNKELFVSRLAALLRNRDLSMKTVFWAAMPGLDPRVVQVPPDYKCGIGCVS